MISKYKNFNIEVLNGDSYALDSVDNTTNYKFVYSGNENYRRTSLHAIKVNFCDIEQSSAALLGNGGNTTIHKNSYIIKDDSIFICCGDSIYSLHIPTLKLNWSKQLDMATCFGIYEFENDFIIHGEIDICRLTKNGAIKWQFSGRDIFLTMDGQKEFEIVGDKIKLIDFQNYQYTIDSDGNEINN